MKLDRKDFKPICIIFGILIIFISLFLIPWIYGIVRLSLKIIGVE